MTLRQRVKNLVGDVLGYGRCPVTGETYWYSEIVSVNYAPNIGVILSPRALIDHSPEHVARVVRERGENTPGATAKGPLYSLEDIASAVKEGNVMRFPRR